MAEASAATTIHAWRHCVYSSGGACLRHAHLTLPPPCSPHLASAMLTSPCLRHAHLTLPSLLASLPAPLFFGAQHATQVGKGLIDMGIGQDDNGGSLPAVERHGTEMSTKPNIISIGYPER